jgi:hypothetical protein
MSEHPDFAAFCVQIEQFLVKKYNMFKSKLMGEIRDLESTITHHHDDDTPYASKEDFEINENMSLQQLTDIKSKILAKYFEDDK